MNKELKRGVLTVSILALTMQLNAAELKPETVDAWQGNLKAAEARMNARLQPGKNFLWIDDQPGRRDELKEGNIVIEPVGHGSIAVPHGLVHDWIGTAFIPGVSLESVLGVTADYDHYKEMYAPNVVDSRYLSSENGGERFSMRLRQKTSFVTTAIEGQYEVRRIRVDERRWYATANSTSIREIRNYGEPDETELPPDVGSGFIWRVYSINRYEQRDGGVYVELEVMVLTRDIPMSLNWVVKPLVTRMSRNSLSISLAQTRRAVQCGKYPGVELSSLERTTESERRKPPATTP